MLEDYLRIRHASQAGAPRVLADLLDKWDIDVFFGTSFPETRYSDRHWITHLRRLPGWVPVFASQTDSVYLRRTPASQRNFDRAKAPITTRLAPCSSANAGKTSSGRPGSMWTVPSGSLHTSASSFTA